MPPAFDKMATVTASTLRLPAHVGGKRGAPTTQIASLPITPIDPVDAELRSRLNLTTPVTLFQTSAQGVKNVSGGTLDLVSSDSLVVGTVTYAIRALEVWEWKSVTHYTIVLEKAEQ